MQVELIRFRKKYRLYSRLLLRRKEFNATRVFTQAWIVITACSIVIGLIIRNTSPPFYAQGLHG